MTPSRSLNPLFIRSFYQTPSRMLNPYVLESLNPLFIRSFYQTYQFNENQHYENVLIPYSSGHSIKLQPAFRYGRVFLGLNPLFIRSFYQTPSQGRVSAPIRGLNPLFIRSFYQTTNNFSSCGR